MKPLRVAFLASEVTPFAKTGGLADVAQSLPRTIGALGHDVRVFLPLYGAIDAEKHGLARELSARGFALFKATLPRSQVPVYFVDCPRYYAREAIYTDDDDEALRFSFFCHAVVESCQHLRFPADVFHLNDWQTALIPLLLKTTYAWDRLFLESKTLLTIHNLGYQGIFAADVLDAIGIHDTSVVDAADLRASTLNYLKTGLLHADHLSTVSPSYAREIQTPEQGYGLDTLLRKRADVLTGILNGVDYDEWNPRHDPYIPFRYSEKSLFRKKKNKKELLSKLNLSVPEGAPLLGMVTRLSKQKGIDLLFDALPEVLERERLALVVLGTGEAKYETLLLSLQRRYPDHVCFYRGFSAELAHWIEAASDMFLMPSKYEPCGLNQMYSLKYGTVPLVRKTGGLADSVRLFDPATGEGTGIVFDHYTPEGVLWAIRAALELYRDEKTWRRMMLNGMAEDFSWKLQAESYLSIYRRLAST